MNTEFIDTWAKISPKNVEGVHNGLTSYYLNRLYKMLVSRFTFDNVPDTFDTAVLNSVFVTGVLGVFDSGQGIYCLPCATYGIDVYDNPTKFSIANHHIIKTDYTIGINGELIYIDRFKGMFSSAYPLLLHYAVQLATLDQSLNTALINSRVAFMFRASNNQELQSYKLMYDEISQGKPAVFLKKGMDDDGSSVLFNNVQNMYVGNELLLTKRQLMNEYLTVIGINNANTDKRERLNADEVHANDIELGTTIHNWLNSLKESIDKVNHLFDFNIVVHLTDYYNEIPELDNGGINNESV